MSASSLHRESTDSPIYPSTFSYISVDIYISPSVFIISPSIYIMKIYKYHWRYVSIATVIFRQIVVAVRLSSLASPLPSKAVTVMEYSVYPLPDLSAHESSH